MASKKGRRKERQQGRVATRVSAAPEASAPGYAVLIAGLLLLLGAAAASMVLVLQHMVGLSVPGCGPGSACARAAASVWGKVPGIGWPTSHVGFAWFLAMAVAWLVVRGAIPLWMRWLVRLSAIGSLVLVAAMLLNGYICPWCMGVHACNLLFVVLIETGGRRMIPRSFGPLPAVVGAVFVFTTAALAFAESREKAAFMEDQQREFDDSTDRIIRETAARGERERAALESDEPLRLAVPLVGRYRKGPERAPIRIVVISDYQCPDCKRVETEIESILAERDDVSFSTKHFPLCSDCNRFARALNFNPHPNACWAARAAEAAGLLYGEEGFWKMHRWLFSVDGAFTAAELDRGLEELEFERAPFLRWMQGPRTLEIVEADIEEGRSLGLHFTPMVFINGVELRGWRVPNAVRRAVDSLAATDPPAMTASGDRPVLAMGKYIDDWREERPRLLTPPTRPWLQVESADDVVEVVVFGDYSEPNSAEVDRLMRRLAASMDGVVYTFRLFPMNNECNPSLPGEMAREGACLAARAAEAAGRLGGREAHQAMHEWLMDNQQNINEASIRSAATRLGIGGSALIGEMAQAAVKAGIEEDCEAGGRVFARGVPHILIDRKWLPRWRLDGEPVIEQILQEAVREKRK